MIENFLESTLKGNFPDLNKSALFLPCIICRQMRVANEVLATFCIISLGSCERDGSLFKQVVFATNQRPVFSLLVNQRTGNICLVTHVWDNLNTDTFVQVLSFA